MKKEEIEVMSKKEEELVEVLQRLEFGRVAAKTLVYMLVRKTVARGKDIERAVDLRQPEVSQGTSTLISRKWVKKSKIKTKGKGRPHYRYRLAMPKKEIINDIKEEIQKRIEQEHQNLTAVRELLLRGLKTLRS